MMCNNGLPSIVELIQDPNPNPNPSKRKRNPPGAPDPDAEVIALSPKSLMATNRFVCEICQKGFKRDQNLQLHKRGHNLPWKLKQRNTEEIVRKKVYTCPEKTCAHHHPGRALGDLTGIKKHYSRKHGEKKWKCGKCCKKYAVQSDLKAHNKTCGTREYKCHCGTLFSRKDSFVTHRAFCNALAAEESGRFATPIPSANMSFRNEIIMKGELRNVHQKNVADFPFSGVFRPEVQGGGMFESGNLQAINLPLWPDNATNLIGNQSAEIVHDHQNQWLNRGVKEEEGYLSQDASSSLYYINSILNQQEANPEAFGLVTTSFQPLDAFNPLNHHQTLENNSTSASTLTSSNNSSHDPLMGLPNYSKSHEGDFTRDFLGVRVKENRDFLQEFGMEMARNY
ncbi:hypothetical protein ACS0TY_014651 [Phlomoides rotata]